MCKWRYEDNPSSINTSIWLDMCVVRLPVDTASPYMCWYRDDSKNSENLERDELCLEKGRDLNEWINNDYTHFIKLGNRQANSPIAYIQVIYIIKCITSILYYSMYNHSYNIYNVYLQDSSSQWRYNYIKFSCMNTQ